MNVTLTPDRPLGLLEKYQLSKSLTSCYGNVTLTALIKHPACQQEPDKFYRQAFAPALKQLIDRHPFLSVAVRDKSNDHAHFVRLSHINLDKLIQVADRTEPVQAIAQQQVSAEFDLDAFDPLWRLYIVPQTESMSQVTIVTHHIICDGMALSLFLKELLRELVHPHPPTTGWIEVNPRLRCSPPYELSGAPELSLLNDVVPMVGKSLIPKVMPAFLADWMDPLRQRGWRGDHPAVDGESHCTEVRAMHVPAEIWRSVLDEAKRRKVTGHAILAAASLLAWAELYPNQITELATPINARRFCQPPVGGDQMGNFVGGHSSVWEGRQIVRQSPWAIAKEYHQGLRTHLTDAVKQPLYLKMLPTFPQSYIDFWQDKRKMHPFGRTGGMEISDLARYDIEDNDAHAWRLEEVYFCQSAQTFTTAFTLSSISFDSQLFCTLSWQKGALEEAKMNRYHEVFIGILKKIELQEFN